MNLKEKITASFSSEKNQSTLDENPFFYKDKVASFDKLKGQEFPTTKVEDWKYTNLSPLLKNEFELFPTNIHSVQEEAVQKCLMLSESCVNLVFVNGFFDSALSSNIEEVSEITNLAAAPNKLSLDAKLFFEEKKSLNNCFVNLNSAFSKDGLLIQIPKGKVFEPVIQILYVSTADSPATMFQTKNLVSVGENAQVKIIESHYNLSDNKCLTNAFTEIYAAKNALVDYHKIQNDSLNSSLIDHTMIHQKSNSEVSMFTLSLGGSLIRNNLIFNHEGQHINSNLYGVSVLNQSQHVDNNTLINHQKPNCESNECYKGVFAENSTGVFNGKVYVHQDAQKTNAYQQNDNILLSNSATINAKPQLEIFADDVKCSHGCTMGELDANALFYLQSRGISKNEAKKLLLYAFANEAIESVKMPTLKNKMEELIHEKLEALLFTMDHQ